jgi:hypothetical protein
MAQIGRAGNNLNQIAKAVNGNLRNGDEIDALAVHAELVSIERALTHFQREQSK